MAGERYNRSRARTYAPRTVFADLAIDALFRFPGADEVFIKSAERCYIARGRTMIVQVTRVVVPVADENMTPTLWDMLISDGQ